MKLAQGQVWKCGDTYFRIVRWARMAIQYKKLEYPDSKEGLLQDVSKKEFCRLIRGGELVEPGPGGTIAS